MKSLTFLFFMIACERSQQHMSSPSSSTEAPSNQDTAPAASSDQIMVLSGGGSPTGNHFSQYLQTRLISEDLAMRSPSLTIHFAAGNRPDQPSDIFDVHRIITDDEGLKFSRMLPGIIPGNQPATLEKLNESFDILAAKSQATPMERFFLVVTDHGMPNPTHLFEDYSDNCIDLWDFNVETLERDGAGRCLSVTELRRFLRDRLQAKRKVFAMSQCYSGGFHRLSVDPDGAYPTADASICGFTSTSWDETASGCTPDVLDATYKGYERYFAQRLTGRDVITGEKLSFPRALSFADAHIAAAKEDDAKDIPMTTSDFYLIEWAKRFEKRKFKPRTQVMNSSEIQKTYNDALDLQSVDLEVMREELGDYYSEIASRLAMIEATRTLIERVDSMNSQWASQNFPSQRRHLRAALSPIKALSQDVDSKIEEYLGLRFELMYQPWRALMEWDDKSEDLMVLRSLENDIGKKHEDQETGQALAWMNIRDEAIRRMSVLAPKDQNAADELSVFAASRERLMLKVAKEVGDEKAIVKIDEAKAILESAMTIHDEIGEHYLHIDLIRRIVFLKQEIAALITLVKMKDQVALGEMKGLIECQATPLP